VQVSAPLNRSALTRRSLSRDTLQLPRRGVDRDAPGRGVELACGLEQPLFVGLDRRRPAGHGLIGQLSDRGFERIAMLV
jgi:hypothetical protein